MNKIDYSRTAYVVVYCRGHIYYQGVQIGGGDFALKEAKAKGHEVRIWKMFGMEHPCELPEETIKEIKAFTEALHQEGEGTDESY